MISRSAYDGTYITHASTTRLTSIHQPYKEIAQEAVRQLMDMIDGPAGDEQADAQNDDQTAEGQPGITTAGQADSTRDVVKYGNIILLPVSVEKGDTTK